MPHTFFHTLPTHTDATALIGDDGSAVSYRDLLTQADALGQKIGERCLVVLMCENSVACVTSYVGLLRAKVVVLLLHPSTPPAQKASIIEQFQPKYICAPVPETKTYALQRTEFAADYPLHEDLCLLLTTSGTTGSRSFVRQSYANVQSNAEAIVQYLGLTAQDRAVTTMPMNYTYGLSILHSHLLAGASVVMTEASLMSPLFWSHLKDHKVTNFGGVPFIYEMLKKLRFAKMDVPDLRLVTQAGGKLRVELVTEFAALCAAKKIDFVVMYGQTEATARMAYLPPAQVRYKPASIGIPIPGGTFTLVDDTGAVIDKPHQAGELIYSGANVTLGYATQCADLAKGDENGGRLSTGDIAQRDEDGFYTIVGRKKRFLKIFGTRVNLDEVETLLQAQGCDCACGGVDDRLVVYTTDNTALDTIKQTMTQKTSLTPQAYHLRVIAEIPRNESGKVDYARLKAMAEG